jgi:hypothetical protein
VQVVSGPAPAASRPAGLLLQWAGSCTPGTRHFPL